MCLSIGNQKKDIKKINILNIQKIKCGEKKENINFVVITTLFLRGVH